MNEITKDEIEFYLFDLASRFKGIDGSKYYLSYSGGKDSHFLYWFIKEYLHDTSIEVVSFNTYMEHPQIRERMQKNADTILIPKMKPFEIKEKYGSPCFSKLQDMWIYRWQQGSRLPYLERLVKRLPRDEEGHVSTFALSRKASSLLLEGKLHSISPLCCKYLKKEPAQAFAEKSGKKPILGVRGGESITRAKAYRSCFTKDRKFTPLYDLKDEMLEAIYQEYGIEIPAIYSLITRTGCMGCPYGSWKGDTKKELDLLNDNQRRFVVEYFRESYDVLGIDYQIKQIQLF